MSHEIRLELMLGRAVVGLDGRSVGHLEEVVTEWQGAEMVVTRYLLGVRSLLKRLSGEILASHAAGLGPAYAARWDQVDIRDPVRPRLTCPASELQRLPSAPD
jgi:hypothetical protein